MALSCQCPFRHNCFWESKHFGKLFSSVTQRSMLDVICFQHSNYMQISRCNMYHTLYFCTTTIPNITTNNKRKRKQVCYNVKLWNSQPVEISREDGLHLHCGGKERINSCHQQKCTKWRQTIHRTQWRQNYLT